MIHNKKLQKIINLILCFVIFFTLSSGITYADDEKDFDVVTELLFRQLTEAILSLGDGVVHLVSSSVGEMVTIDRLIYNKVEKVSIDFWDDMPSDGSSSQEPVKAFMKPVINKWYPVFFNIATMVYMVVLVYIGVAIIFSSTAEKKANYKQLFMTWCVGIAILFMFPYVMKYIVIINNAFVTTLDDTAYFQPGGDSKLAKSDFGVAIKYGKAEFKELFGDPKGDVMFLAREAAQKHDSTFSFEKDTNLSLAIMYVILVGQMVSILIMYYKRAFMVAFLITIFPLVAMTYVLDKIGDGKNQSFGIWFKEFIINVIVQMFHAVVYLLVTGAGIKLYLDNGGQNLIFTLLCIWFLFEGEKILRTIFNMNSSAKTMGDIATSGALALTAITKGAGLFKKDEENGSKRDNKEINNANTRIKNRSDRAKENNKAAIVAIEEKKNAGESTKSYGEYQGSDNEPEGVREPRYDIDNAKDVATVTGLSTRKPKLASKTIKKVAGLTGGALGLTKELASGKASPASAITGFVAGEAIGEGVVKPARFAVEQLEHVGSGINMYRKTMRGDFNGQLGIKLPPTATTQGDNSNPDLSAAESQMDSKEKIHQELMARYTRNLAIFGKDIADVSFYEYLEKNRKK